MNPEEKLRILSRYLDDFINEYDDSDKNALTENELREYRGAYKFALEICIRFHLEEWTD